MKTLVLLFLSFNFYAQDVYVNGYTRSDGTYVEGHYRTTPNYTTNDNYSTIGNQNPYTGKWGTESGDSYTYNYYYDAPIQTNPLANTLPVPIEKEYKPIDLKLGSDTTKITKDTVFELSQNVKDYQYEQTHPSPLESLKDDKFKFNDFNKPVSNVQRSSDVGMWVVIGMGALIFILLFTIIFKSKTQ